MNRREFVSGSMISVGTAGLGLWPKHSGAASTTEQGSTLDATQVRRVLAVFKCHLDIGFTDTQAKVIQQYFTHFFPQAIATIAALRAAGSDRYVWTTGSWLLYQYLEQANAAARRKMEDAIAAGDIAWHALPFNWQTEMIDESMIQGCLGFSASLDQRFGRKTTGAKMTDVPGHSRGIIRPLAAAGVTLLDIGVNPASTPPEVPASFIWKDPEGHSLAMLYHHRAYGGRIQIPQTDLAIAVEVRVDNTGPHSEDEVKTIYADLRQQFPHATITATSMSGVAAAVDQIRDRLPVVTQEIGDTWVYGVPSDPVKIARYREVSRLRKEWVEQKHFAIGDKTDRSLLAKLALAPEHTWGTDTKRFVDYDHYKPADLAKVLDQSGYRTMERSWQEKRDDIDSGIATLPLLLQEQARARFKTMNADRPSQDGLAAHNAHEEIDTRHFTIRIDPKTGSIVGLRSKHSGREWATPAHPLALFVYQTLSAADYEAFLANYVRSKEWWAPRDFGKPEIGRFKAESREWQPALKSCSVGRRSDAIRIVTQLTIEDAESSARGGVAWPETIYMELELPDTEPLLRIAFVALGKAPNRMPESMWLTFAPDAPEASGWELDKVDQPVSPLDVVRGGARSMHAVTNTLRYKDDRGSFQLSTLDAPAIAVGQRSPLNFSNDLPDMSAGIHVNLFNNAWGTNYLQWAGGDWLCRFTLEVD